MRVATYNLRHHANRWAERFPLVVHTLLQADADLIGLQEVSLRLGNKDQATLIADAMNEQLGLESYKVFFREGAGYLKGKEGIAFLYRVPFLATRSIDLPVLWRVAQLAKVKMHGQIVGVINTHLHHKPIENEEIRYPQTRRVLEWAKSHPFPCVIVGDFNAQPDSSTIKMIKQSYSSAYEQYNGQEPEFTWPTPLLQADPTRTEMIDYVFYDPSKFQVDHCELIGTYPAVNDESLYPSDHFGILATLTPKA
jgi:endonuclease/exonuclease/phosphatase family metal-dependent hydrolase